MPCFELVDRRGSRGSWLLGHTRAHVLGCVRGCRGAEGRILYGLFLFATDRRAEDRPPGSVLRVARPSRSCSGKATATATLESGSASFTRPNPSERALNPRTYDFCKDDRSIILV